jgi:hypothetical protein
MTVYGFKTEPYAHQRASFEDSWAAEFYALFMEMGTGKSKVVIDTIGVLHEQGRVNAALIVAPKGVYDNWVRGEIPLHLPSRIPRALLRWSASKTMKFERELKTFIVSQELGLKILCDEHGGVFDGSWNRRSDGVFISEPG